MWSSETAAVAEQLALWFRSPPGAELLRMEQAVLDRMLPDLFGYHIVQVGCSARALSLDASRIAHKVMAETELGAAAAAPGAPAVVCSSDALPLAADSVDVVVLMHVLEYSANPHKVLREVARALIGEGHLVLACFNPWSLYGLSRLALAWRDTPPWCGHFYGLTRIRDWLALLDLEVLRVERLFFRPPFSGERVLRRLSWMENLGRHVWPVFGGAYVVLARKRVAPLTPVRMRWHARRSMIASGVAEPSA
jgi:SAM-dependent methyltransferase